MPRHRKEDTPLEKRRIPKGEAVGRLPNGVHTAQSLSDLEALKARWRLSDTAVIHRALRLAVERGD